MSRHHLRSALAVAVALTACSGRAEPVSATPLPVPVPSSGPVLTAVESNEASQPEEEAPEPPPAATIARLFVLSDPTGQDVYIDEGERPAGTTPLRLSLAPGEHSIDVVFSSNDDDGEAIEASTQDTVEGGREYRFFAMLPNDEDPVEPDAAASEPAEVIRAHREPLEACHALTDTADLAFAYDPAGVVYLTQAFGAMPVEPLRCATIEMLSWRLPAGATGRYVSFVSSTMTPRATAASDHATGAVATARAER